MRDAIIRDLSTGIDQKIAEALVISYENTLSRFWRGDIDGSLAASGLFFENALRAIEFLRTSKVLTEIKNFSAAVTAIMQDTNLTNDSLRFLIPRIVQAAWEIRSKRGAVHVKEISPMHIDASLGVQSASWVLAEFLRLYHNADENLVAGAMATLMRGHIPFVETFAGESVVTRDVPCSTEMLLLLSRGPLDRTALGKASKFRPPAVTVALQKLEEARKVHKTANGDYYITGPGERLLTEFLVAQGATKTETPRS